MEHEIKSVELPNRVRLPYVEQGDPLGVPVILLPGYADSQRSFDLLLPHLPDSVRAFALTPRGHGDASQPAAGYHPRDLAADLAAFMEALHIEPAVIVGGSSGGIVARRFAIDNPGRTMALMLLGSPLTLRDKPGVLGLWNSTISKLADPIDSRFVREFVESTVVRSVPQAFLDIMVKENLKVPAHVWRATLEGLLDEHSSEELDRIKAPTVIIWGDQDKIVPYSDQQALTAAISGSRLVVYRGAGHVLYWEQPARVASDIAVFIEALVG